MSLSPSLLPSLSSSPLVIFDPTVTKMITLAQEQVPLWKLLVQLLPDRDPETEWFTLDDLVPLLGVSRRALADHARDLWPDHEGHWKLNYGQAVSLVRRVAYVGRKLPSRSDIIARLQRSKK